MTPKRRKACAAHLAWWRDAIGEKTLAQLTPALLREQLDRLGKEPYTSSKPRKVVTLTPRREEPKQLTQSASSVNCYKERLSKILSIAVIEYEWMPENPLTKIPDRKEPQGRVRFLSVEERTRCSMPAVPRVQVYMQWSSPLCALAQGQGSCSASPGEMLTSNVGG